MSNDAIKKEIAESIAVKQALARDCANEIEKICTLCIEAMSKGGTLYFCGNGGSFTDACHIVGELVGRYAVDRPGLPAIALGANAAALTAVANDYGYEAVFVREVEALIDEDDVVIGLSTSGKSKNVILALALAGEIGATVIGFTGANKDTPMDELCDAVLHVPSTLTPRIQESHILVGHILAGAIEAALREPSE